MKALVIGKKKSLQLLIGDELKRNGFEVFLSESRDRFPDGDFDVCVDISAASISDVKAVTERLRDRPDHYILLSSCLVYPPLERLFPWRPDHIDLCDETGFSTVDRKVRSLRAVERELRHAGVRAMPWTILRPSIIETGAEPEENTLWWFVSRILDGGPIVLPDGDDPLFRHIADTDLARAIRFIAGKKEAYFQTLHVTSSALLSFESYARLVMEGLGRKVPVVRVPATSWKDAGLQLPMGEYLRSSFIEDSAMLAELGWQPTDEKEWARIQAGQLAGNPLSRPVQRERELSLLARHYDESSERAVPPGAENWQLAGIAGEPLSLCLVSCPGDKSPQPPLLMARKILMGMAEERFLVAPSSGRRRIIMGHNVLLELVDPGKTGLLPGAPFLPVAVRPCGEKACSFCSSSAPGIAGIDDDGFGRSQVSIPESHLVPVPAELTNVALLADPLACLLSVVPPLLEEKSGSVWIFGERIEALLAILLVRETGRPLLHVSRTKVDPSGLPFELQSMVLQRAEKKVRDKSLASPDLVLNLSGAMDGENLLAHAVSEGGCLVTPFARDRKLKRRVNVRLPPAAPSREWLLRGVEQLGKWAAGYDLVSFLQPVSPEHPHELFGGKLFCQPFADTGRDDR